MVSRSSAGASSTAVQHDQESARAYLESVAGTTVGKVFVYDDDPTLNWLAHFREQRCIDEHAWSQEKHSDESVVSEKSVKSQKPEQQDMCCLMGKRFGLPSLYLI